MHYKTFLLRCFRSSFWIAICGLLNHTVVSGLRLKVSWNFQFKPSLDPEILNQKAWNAWWIPFIGLHGMRWLDLRNSDQSLAAAFWTKRIWSLLLRPIGRSVTIHELQIAFQARQNSAILDAFKLILIFRMHTKRLSEIKFVNRWPGFSLRDSEIAGHDFISQTGNCTRRWDETYQGNQITEICSS